MRTARGIASALTLLVVCAAGAWAAQPAKARKAPQVKPEIRKQLKAMRVQRLELMRARLDLALLREKGAPEKQIKAAQGRLKALHKQQRDRWEKFRSRHPQAARRLAVARRGGAAGRMAPRGPMGRGMGPQGRMKGQGMRQGMGPRQGWMGRRGMRQGMGPQGCPMGPWGGPAHMRLGQAPPPPFEPTH